jgi:vesicle-associated membrane protein 4
MTTIYDDWIPRSEPYDPYLPRGGAAGSSSGATRGAGGSTQTAHIQKQIDETVSAMRDNIASVAERGERLDALQDKTGEILGLFLDAYSGDAGTRRSGMNAWLTGISFLL